MIIFITGTPGTGKSTVAHILKEQTGLKLIDLNKLINEEKLYTGIHEEWKYKIVDLDALCHSLNNKIADLKDQEDLLVEGHLSHFCRGADVIIILRAHPNILRERLNNKGFARKKIIENIEAEALDVCAFEAFQIYDDKTNEIDTSNKSPEEVVDIIKKIITGEEHLPAGQVDFSDYLIS